MSGHESRPSHAVPCQRPAVKSINEQASLAISISIEQHRVFYLALPVHYYLQFLKVGLFGERRLCELANELIYFGNLLAAYSSCRNPGITDSRGK